MTEETERLRKALETLRHTARWADEQHRQATERRTEAEAIAAIDEVEFPYRARLSCAIMDACKVLDQGD